MNRSLLVILAILSACAYIGSALDCYVCAPIGEERLKVCSDPFEYQSPIATCHYGDVCVKVHTPKISIGNDDSFQLVGRSCGSQSTCDEEAPDMKKYCSVCNTNLCNLAVTIRPALSTAIVLYGINFILSLNMKYEI